MESHDVPTATLCDYYTGRLEGEAAQTVEAHLATCLACRDLLRVMALLSGAPPEAVTPPGEGHPTMEEIVCYYRDRASLEAVTVKHIDAHLRDCKECNSEIGFLKELEDDLRRASG